MCERKKSDGASLQDEMVCLDCPIAKKRLEVGSQGLIDLSTMSNGCTASELLLAILLFISHSINAQNGTDGHRPRSHQCWSIFSSPTASSIRGSPLLSNCSGVFPRSHQLAIDMFLASGKLAKSPVHDK
jgi:hypothetical protein